MRYCVPVAFSGLTQAARVIAPPGFRAGLSGANACCLLPLRPKALPYTPGAQDGDLFVAAWFPLPEASKSVVPLPSSICQCPTKASARETVVNTPASDQAPLPAAFAARTRQ